MIFFLLEWLALCHSSSLLMQQKAVYFSNHPSDMEKGLERALSWNPQSGPVRLYQAGMKMSAKDYEKAREQTMTALQYYSSISALKQLASIEWKISNREAACRGFEKALRLDPGDKASRVRLIALYLSLKETEPARDHCLRYLDMYPGEPDGYYFLGVMRGLEGEASGALSCFSTAENLMNAPGAKPLFTQADLFYRMAGQEAALGRWNAADAHFKKALALQPELTYIKDLASVYRENQHSENAEAIIRQGLKRHPGNRELMKTLATLEGDKNNDRKEH